MKNITKLFAIATIVLGFATTSFAQATATASSSATIVAPITLTKTVDMNFGNVAVIGAGTVTLSPGGLRALSGGVTLPVAAGTVTAATFTVGGEGNSTYSITLPTSDLTITRASGTETMIVNAFTSNPGGTGTLSAGAQTINVGATLNVGAGQVPGLYTTATGFNVTVNYN
jgi:hypothetical protein